MDLFGTIGDILQSALTWIQGLAPGGFGLLILPIGFLAIVSLLVARRR